MVFSGIGVQGQDAAPMNERQHPQRDPGSEQFFLDQKTHMQWSDWSLTSVPQPPLEVLSLLHGGHWACIVNDFGGQ